MVPPVLQIAPPGLAARAWDLPAAVVLPGALLVAVLISTQFLFQPFVWRNWPVDEVLLGWFDVLRERAVTALAIGIALVAVGRVQSCRPSTRALLLCLAIACGAAVGELAPVAADERTTTHDLHLALGRVLQWTLVGCSIAAMVTLWRRSVQVHAAVQAAELRRSQVESQLAQMRLQWLRSRIEPHFLFNTLATVRRLHHTDPAQGARLLAHFLSYLRMTLASEHLQHATLGQEIDLVEAYLGIVALRMSGRLAVRCDVPENLRCCDLPPLTIATLVENAVKHGRRSATYSRRPAQRSSSAYGESVTWCSLRGGRCEARHSPTPCAGVWAARAARAVLCDEGGRVRREHGRPRLNPRGAAGPVEAAPWPG